MTAATLDTPVAQSGQPTLAVAAGRNLIAAGSIFGAANLFQWGVLSGALHLHPALLALSWPVAVTVFIVTVRRLRSLGGQHAIRAASWSRWSIAAQIAAALSLAAASGLTGNWELMRWMSPIGLGFYGVAFAVAVARGGPKWLGGLALGSFIAAAGVAQLVGTPQQYLAYAGGLVAFALIPGAILAFGRAR
ncbi:hypothetical protein [Brevundimonas sp. NIBR11]|uniref:hypothetical protein n=1 Tax=Brevundimonas sp. NIBR11 TaxID=3015999 RepID=UPI0022F133F8|nr:hypothetical protein [Brevundimonas sp. NIBR11]WGM32352.1 hypothetical protein KKHFBJBL_02603 [Brevundimonas sp. NIBR11]